MSEAVHRLREAGITRRWHPYDVPSHRCDSSPDGVACRKPAPNVHNSLAIQKKHVASMYRSWDSLNAYAHGPLDTDQYARHIPVGRVCMERTSQAPLTETELGNMYAGSHVFAPGPCAYGIGEDPWCDRTGPRMPQAPRKCMTSGPGHPQLPHAKRGDGGGPGPGAYTTSDSAVMRPRGGTFAAVAEQRGAAAALETAQTRLETLQWRADFVRRGLREPEGLRPGQALVVRTEERELRRMDARASWLRREVESLAQLAEAAAEKRSPAPGASIGPPPRTREEGAAGVRRPSTTSACDRARRRAQKGSDRFYDPIASTATFHDSPGPGTYDVAKDVDCLGRGSIKRSPSFHLFERRVVGNETPERRNLASLKLHRLGGHGLAAPFHAYGSSLGAGQYTPDICAPLFPNQGQRRRRRGRRRRS